MAFEIKPFPEWSWSQSRDGLFNECRRKYFFHYYQSHNGWLRDSEETAKTAYRLKQITNLYLILGDGIHQLAESALKEWRDEKSLLSEVESIKQIRNHLNQAYLDSQQLDQWKFSPKKFTMLHEIYYGGKLPDHRVGKIKQRMDACVKHFFESKSLKELQGGQDIQIIEVEELNIFSILDEKIYVKLDLLYKRQDDTWVIVDWKTGTESEKNEQQLLLYALFLNDKYHVPFDKMEIRIEYLLTGESVSTLINKDEVERMKMEVAQSTYQMKQYLADEKENQPLPMDFFPPNADKKRCVWCSFREICDEKILD